MRGQTTAGKAAGGTSPRAGAPVGVFRGIRRRVLLPVLVAAVLTGCSGGPEPESPSTARTTPTAGAPESTTSSSPASSSPATADPVPDTQEPLPPPYIERVVWEQTEVGPSLQIYPTANGRQTVGERSGDVAWSEVLALAPDGGTPGMYEQFMCHWTFARIVDPAKPSWNIEPQRPVVAPEEMIAARCNPGFAEEPGP